MKEQRCIKQYLKFIFKKSYRDSLFRLEREGVIKRIHISKIKKNIKYLILLRENTKVGTFSDYIVFLREIEFALEKNYIPVIDRKTIKNIFFPAEDIVNTWEVFFEQPLKLGLNDALNSNADVYVKYIPSRLDPVSLMHCRDTEIVKYWREVAKKYIRFNEQTINYLKQAEESYIRGKRVLGVSIREGYIKLYMTEPEKIQNHPRQLEIKDLLKIVEERLVRWDCEYVFFTCQTTDTVELFKKMFKNKALYFERNRKSYNDLSEGSKIYIKDYNEGFENELGYITEMYLLSRCTSFLCSENSGSEAAFIMSEGFENFECIEKGTY